MTWFKVDDSFYDHPKVERLSLAARGLWVTAGSYAARHLTDGFVPDSILKRVGRGVPAATRELCSVGLWSSVPGGIRFHDWDQFQPSRESVEADRNRAKERQKAWRERKRNGVTNAATNGERNGVSNTTRRNSAPTRPDPTNTPLPPAATSPDHSAGDPAGAGGEINQPNFDDFWDTYPKRAGQHRARAAWTRAIRDTNPNEILAGLAAALPRLTASDPQFIPDPANWLRDERWADTPPEPDRDPWANMPKIGPTP